VICSLSWTFGQLWRKFDVYCSSQNSHRSPPSPVVIVIIYNNSSVSKRLVGNSVPLACQSTSRDSVTRMRCLTSNDDIQLTLMVYLFCKLFFHKCSKRRIYRRSRTLRFYQIYLILRQSHAVLTLRIFGSTFGSVKTGRIQTIQGGPEKVSYIIIAIT